MSCTLKEFMNHERDSGEPMKVGESVGETLIVMAEAVKACLPAEGAFHHPTARQQHKPLFGCRELDHLKCYSVYLSLPCRCFARVALIYIGQFHVVSSDLLDLRGKLSDLRTLLQVGRCRL